MTKSDFVSLVANKSGLTKKDAEAALDGVLASVTEQLAKGESVTFVGFGTFSAVERAPRTAKVPSTGEKIEVPAKKVAKFKVGKNLKEAVAGTKAKAASKPKGKKK